MTLSKEPIKRYIMTEKVTFPDELKPGAIVKIERYVREIPLELDNEA